MGHVRFEPTLASWSVPSRAPSAGRPVRTSGGAPRPISTASDLPPSHSTSDGPIAAEPSAAASDGRFWTTRDCQPLRVTRVTAPVEPRQISSPSGPVTQEAALVPPFPASAT